MINKVFDLAPPVLIGLAVDVVERHLLALPTLGITTVSSQLITLAMLSFLVWTAESLFEYLYGILWRNLAQSAQHSLRLEAYDHLQKLEMDFFEQDSGRLLTVLNDDINQLERFLDHGANELLHLIYHRSAGGRCHDRAGSAGGHLCLPADSGDPLGIASLSTSARTAVPRCTPTGRRHGQPTRNNLGGMLTIKSFARESWELEQLRRESEAYGQSNRQAIRISAAFIPLIRFAILFAFLAILLIGGLQAFNGVIAVGTYSFLVFITQRLLWPLTTLGRTLNEYQRSMASTNRVLDLIDTPVLIAGGERRLNPRDIQGEIRYESVCFAYRDRPALLPEL